MRLNIKVLLTFIFFCLNVNLAKGEAEPKKPKVLFDLSHGQF